MLKFFHLEKNASPFISVGSINLLTEMGSLMLSFCCRPPMVKLKIKRGNYTYKKVLSFLAALTGEHDT